MVGFHKEYALSFNHMRTDMIAFQLLYLHYADKEAQKAVEVVCANEDCMAEIPEHLSFNEVYIYMLHTSYAYNTILYLHACV